MLSSPAAAAAVVLCLALDDCASISNAKLPAKLPATFRARARKIPFTRRAFSVVQCAYSLERALSESGGQRCRESSAAPLVHPPFLPKEEQHSYGENHRNNPGRRVHPSRDSRLH